MPKQNCISLLVMNNTEIRQSLFNLEIFSALTVIYLLTGTVFHSEHLPKCQLKRFSGLAQTIFDCRFCVRGNMRKRFVFLWLTIEIGTQRLKESPPVSKRKTSLRTGRRWACHIWKNSFPSRRTALSSSSSLLSVCHISSDFSLRLPETKLWNGVFHRVCPSEMCCNCWCSV